MAPATDDTASLCSTYKNIEALLTSLETYKSADSVKINETYRCEVMSKYPRNILHELAPGKVLTPTIIRENMKIALEAREDVDNITKSVTKTESEKNCISIHDLATNHHSEFIKATKSNNGKQFQTLPIL